MMPDESDDDRIGAYVEKLRERNMQSATALRVRLARMLDAVGSLEDAIGDDEEALEAYRRDLRWDARKRAEEEAKALAAASAISRRNRGED